MHHSEIQTRDTYLDLVIKHISKDQRKAAAVDPVEFILQFFRHVPLHDLTAIPPKDASCIAMEAFGFFQERRKPAHEIRSYLPNEKKHGWLSHRRIIEVKNDDMPFLLDSLTAELNRQDCGIHLIAHPIFEVERDDKGKLTRLLPPGEHSESSHRESFIHFQVTTSYDEREMKDMLTRLGNILSAVRLAVEDWKTMVARVYERIGKMEALEAQLPESQRDEIEEAADFLNWLRENHFTFLGYIEYDFEKSGKKLTARPVKGSELGLFRITDPSLRPAGLESLPGEMMRFMENPQLIEITKSNRRSIVHRSVHMDYVGVKRFDDKGRVIGECRFLGLFTSLVYYQSPDLIPLVRRKINYALDRSGFQKASHDFKGLRTILEFYPRDELFQVTAEELYETCLGILSLELRPRVRIFVRRDRFERFLSCQIFVPRDRYSTQLREKFQSILEEAFHGEISAYYTQVTDSPLARLHVLIKTKPGEIPDVDLGALQQKLKEATSQWHDNLREAIQKRYGEKHGEKMHRFYKNAFPAAYTNTYEPGAAVHDILRIEDAQRQDQLMMDLYNDLRDSEAFHLKIYNPGRQVPLSDILPVLENMGLRVLDELPFLITPLGSEGGVWIRDFRVTAENGPRPDLSKIGEAFRCALLKVWYDQASNDAFNKLTIAAGMHWRDVMMLRAYSRYLRQSKFLYGQQVTAEALARHAGIAQLLVELFYTKFDPKAKTGKNDNRAKKIDTLHRQILGQLDSVTSIEDDRIIRRFIGMIDATLRTNFFQTGEGGEPKSYISFKLDSARVPELPLPRPFAEIFVYSVRVEGIHLRGGKVARGGLRWSDRQEDYRTEVLGLMKAQMVKNAVIVPEGSKGGFIVKRPPSEGGRDAMMAEGIECYKTFLRGLLDLTDNLAGGKVIPPKDVVRYDADDPYLVVAADKGTATFSDIANSVSEEYGFWLGDAFASGGSAGYDHKKMGITARGAWVSVQRHFNEMGIDVQTQPVTVTGIGDMSGDVFGNGMLLSRTIKLVAAFNHLHIFLDPDPDPEKSFRERERLFNLQRSGWPDYDTKLISKGGGVFDRKSKSLDLSPEVRKLLGIQAKTLSPDELIRAILCAPVDLLWNGGIGTYVKAHTESHEDVGDKANNALRVNGRDLRCTVVGEGGNLGFTQRGRIEYALKGGRINTDAIDNSAGVDCSDHEVNIKIAFQRSMEEKRLTRARRDKILAEMTDDVAYLVLRDNQLQTQALTIAQQQGSDLMDSQARLLSRLERDGLLDRNIEYLPDDEELMQRKKDGSGLTRPELSVVLAYSKLAISRDIIHSNLPDDPYMSSDLLRYFPGPMQEKFAEDIRHHPLRREIITTVATNSMVNRVGSTFFHDIKDDTGVKGCDIVRAYTVTRDAFKLRGLWSAIEALGPTVPVELRVSMFVEINRFVDRATLWFLRNCPQPLDISAIMENYMPGIEEFGACLPEVLSSTTREIYDDRVQRFSAPDVPKELTLRIASLDALVSACDVVKVSQTHDIPLRIIAGIYFELGTRLRLGWLRLAAARIQPGTHWDRLALASVISDLFSQQRRLTAEVIRQGCSDEQCDLAVKTWCERNMKDVERYDALIHDLRATENIDFASIIVAKRRVEEICATDQIEATVAVV